MKGRKDEQIYRPTGGVGLQYQNRCAEISANDHTQHGHQLGLKTSLLAPVNYREINLLSRHTSNYSTANVVFFHTWRGV